MRINYEGRWWNIALLQISTLKNPQLIRCINVFGKDVVENDE